LAGGAKALVDLEGAIKVGVVDESLPADSGAGFLTLRRIISTVTLSPG